METLVDRVKGKLESIAGQIESNLKSISDKADLAAKNIAKMVRGYLGQSPPG